MDALIEFKNVTKRFGKKVVVENINLKIKKGEIFGIIGSSGAGKTTLLNTLIAFYEPEEGDVLYRFNGKLVSVFRRSHKIKKIFGFAAQTPSYYDKLTVKENLDYFSDMYSLSKTKRKQNIPLILELTGMADAKNTVARDLSGGMQKRLDIACSLVNDPEVLILDEPTADLDPVLRKQLWELLKKIKEKGTTIIIASHFLSELELICNRIAILDKGHVVELGTLAQLRDIFSKNEEIHLNTIPGNYNYLLKKMSNLKPGIKKVVKEGHGLIIYTQNAEKVLHHLLHVIEHSNEKVIDIRVNKPTLNEIFESLTKK